MVQNINVSAAYSKREDYLNKALTGDGISIHISKGNTKLGAIPSFSVLPLITCKNCGEWSKICYACRGNFNNPSVIIGESENTALLIKNPELVENELNSFLNNPTIIYKYFRFNVAGDIFSRDYLEMIINIAASNPNTKFLAFTKNYELINDRLYMGKLPSNLNIVLSRWGNTPIDNPHNLPIAIAKTSESTDTTNAFHCMGNCEACFKCWNIGRNESVYFDLH